MRKVIPLEKQVESEKSIILLEEACQNVNSHLADLDETDYQDITDETIKGNISSLVANVNNNRYVDIFPISNWNDLPNIAAYSRWYHDSLGVYTGAKNAIIGCRGRLFAMQSNTGAATKEYTFRPVITGN